MNKITKQLSLIIISILTILSQLTAAEIDPNAVTNIKINNMTDYFVWIKDIKQKNVGFGPREWGMSQGKGIQPNSKDIVPLHRWVSEEAISRDERFKKGPAPAVTAKLLFGLNGNTPETSQSINFELSPNSPKKIAKEMDLGDKKVEIEVNIETEPKEISSADGEKDTYYDYFVTITANAYWQKK